MPSPETDADYSDASSIETLRDRWALRRSNECRRYVAVTSAGAFVARPPRGPQRGDMRLRRDPQIVKIEEGQEKEDPSSTSGDSSPPRLTPVSRANDQRIRRDEKESKSS